MACCLVPMIEINMQSQLQLSQLICDQYQTNDQRFGIRSVVYQCFRVTVAVAGITIGCLQNAMISAASSERPVYEATYVVEFNGIEVGTSKRTVSITEEGLAVSRHVFTPQGLAALLGEKAYVDTTQIDLSMIPFRPIETQREGKGAENSYVIDFKWKDRVIKQSNGSTLPMPKREVHDLESLIMSLMVLPQRQKVGDVIALLERANRLRIYVIDEIQEDVLTLTMNEVSTMRYKLQAVNDHLRGYTVWILSERHNLLARLDRYKGSDNLSLTIRDFREFVSAGN